MILRSFATFFVLVCSASLVAEEPPAAIDPPAVPDRAALERKFEQTMSGAVMVGSYTLTGGPEEKPPQAERYTIEKVRKVDGDLWVFTARIQYGDHDIKLPIPLEIKWAGDTPVITLTDAEIPGLGKFTARVLIYRGQYAGTWSGGDHGGQLFGAIEKPPASN